MVHGKHLFVCARYHSDLIYTMITLTGFNKAVNSEQMLMRFDCLTDANSSTPCRLLQQVSV